MALTVFQSTPEFKGDEMAIGAVVRGDMVVAVVPSKGIAGLFLVDSVNGDDLGIVPVDQAARAVNDSGEPIAHCSISSDVFSVLSSSSTRL